MALDPRIVRRSNGGYAFRGWVPRELRELVPGGRSGQKWISLGTTNRAEAQRRARVRSVKFDCELDIARTRLRGEAVNLSKAEAERWAGTWLHQLLAKDEQLRRNGPRLGQAEEFEEQLQEADYELERLEKYVRQALRTGKMENDEYSLPKVYTPDGVELNPDTSAWKLAVYEFMKSSQVAVKALQARNRGDVSETPQPPAAVAHVSNCSVDGLIKDYLDDPTFTRTPGTLKTYRTVFRAMRELLGADTDINSIHRTDCERIRAVIIRLPKNATQRFPKLSLLEAANLADEKNLPRLGIAAVNNYLNNLSSLFKWGVKTWRVTRNPAEGLAITDTRNQRELRHSFTPYQLQAIFNAPLYTGCRDDEDGYATLGSHVIRRGRFWVPLLSLWTGMRLGECCQLRTDDVTSYDGVNVILINDLTDGQEDETDRKRVKTEAGRRFVPVHPELERIGFLNFVERQRARKERRLFPEITPDSQGSLSGTFSKWFNDKRRFLGKLGLVQEGISFHSFRHNYRDALREAGIPLDCVRALGGWRRDSDGEEAIYGNGHRAQTLYGHIQKIKYPEIDLSRLYFKK
ncbi:DUF6538 domain-containing protein [Methylobacterium sp.]|uniref:DUF6538 domain-containing protein n=1 Tax=Methylobacterium sp. TaxID=409 RepID=UPI003B02DDF0